MKEIAEDMIGIWLIPVGIAAVVIFLVAMFITVPLWAPIYIFTLKEK